MFAIGLARRSTATSWSRPMLIAVPTGRQDLQLARRRCGAASSSSRHADAVRARLHRAVHHRRPLRRLRSPSFPVDWQVHDTLLHRRALPLRALRRRVFGVFAGIYYWFPKMSGRMLDERLGQVRTSGSRSSASTSPSSRCTCSACWACRGASTPTATAGCGSGYNLMSTIGSGVMSARDPRLRRQRDPDGEGRGAGGQRPLARRHARVVHVLAAAAGELHRAGTVRVEPPAATRPAAAAEGEGGNGDRRHLAAWLRLTALAASAATLLAVVSGAPRSAPRTSCCPRWRCRRSRRSRSRPGSGTAPAARAQRWLASAPSSASRPRDRHRLHGLRERLLPASRPRSRSAAALVHRGETLRRPAPGATT